MSFFYKKKKKIETVQKSIAKNKENEFSLLFIEMEKVFHEHRIYYPNLVFFTKPSSLTH